MQKRFHESVASVSAESQGDGVFDVTIITPGWGSSGYYSESMLQEYGPRVFTKNRAMFANHPTEAEFASGRDVTKIMAKLVEDSRWEDGVLKAKVKVGNPYREFVAEYMETIGLSIFVEGDFQEGEIEGRTGAIVESLNAADPYASVDFVVAAGRGGKIDRAFEAFRAAEAVAETNSSSSPDGVNERKTNVEIKELGDKLDLLKTALESFSQDVKTAIESLKPAEPAEGEVDFAAVAEKVVAEESLTPSARKRVFESVKSGTKAEDAITAAKAEADEYKKLFEAQAVEAEGRVGGGTADLNLNIEGWK